MSKVSISGNNAGSGTFTIAAPDSNNNRTFNLPDETGVVVTDSTDLEPQVKTSLNATGDAPLFACRAFCNFDGTGTVSIRASGNVSSITDNGTGDYTMNFATEMPDDDFAACITGGDGNNNTAILHVYPSDGGYSNASIRIFGTSNTSPANDNLVVNVSIFR